MDKIANILLVEDDQLDVMDIKRTLDKTNILYQLHVASNGEEAMNMLSGKTQDGNQVNPDIMLIDINMPRMNGLELLGVIRNSEQWKNMKCFIVTTSEEKVDREAAKKLGVSGYIVKPLKLSNTTTMDSFNLMIDLMNIK
jgi:CheY-like chemotaxis protein